VTDLNLPNPERLMTPGAIARLTGVSSRAIRAAIHRGALPAATFGAGGWFRIRWADFVRWRDGARFVPPPPPEDRARARAAAALARQMRRRLPS
jgi:excisionase family DNA binding protein